MGGVLSSAKLVVEYHRTAGRQKDLQLGTHCAVCRNNHATECGLGNSSSGGEGGENQEQMPRQHRTKPTRKKNGLEFGKFFLPKLKTLQYRCICEVWRRPCTFHRGLDVARESKTRHVCSSNSAVEVMKLRNSERFPPTAQASATCDCENKERCVRKQAGIKFVGSRSPNPTPCTAHLQLHVIIGKDTGGSHRHAREHHAQDRRKNIGNDMFRFRVLLRARNRGNAPAT